MAGTGDRIRKLREKKGWTLDYLAEKAKVSKGFLSEIENDKANVGSKILLKIATALDASVDYLLKGDTNKSQEIRPVVIPPKLSKVAEELKLSYAETLEVLMAHDSVVGRRSDSEQKEFTEEDWRELHSAIKRVFG